MIKILEHVVEIRDFASGKKVASVAARVVAYKLETGTVVHLGLNIVPENGIQSRIAYRVSSTNPKTLEYGMLDRETTEREVILEVSGQEKTVLSLALYHFNREPQCANIVIEKQPDGSYSIMLS